ncbi:hypothetical protein L226DRAFT_538461 [Lentinus tigrinus ALCF2SS1-7]|uniref:ER transporter 6TM N-terminal domain-containing protein n=1 Tax=Lentinus tigrinus ALCF2SS1-6 TaxID=1328759 RepID=A0A5C2RZC2_9APHY|nr:hypothetical protein L227DRAFT_579046 [Lentinus tigrinus ALCF2SS1-6]RPD71105.1 hypothetical protein L226DRAFT_538461 [Lentinus tigrinus ALCF2SS1-7]
MTDRQRYDPRLGDEELGGDEVNGSAGHAEDTFRPPRHVRIPTDIAHDSEDSERTQKEGRWFNAQQRRPWSTGLRRAGKACKRLIPIDLGWIPANFTWSKLKPVIRCAVVCWVSTVLMIIPRTSTMMGQGSFLILISAFLDAPHDPFLAVLERELIFITLVVTAWAWTCLGIFLANLARTNIDYNATATAIQSGQYLEAGPTVILAVFIFFGSAFFLFLKAKLGPGPYIFACVFSCICIDISITTAVLYPYPFYRIGQVIAVPLAFHCALCIVISAIVFPVTITAQYTHNLYAVLAPLHGFLAEHRKVLALNPCSEDFQTVVKSINSALAKSEGGLGQAAATSRLLKQDIVYGRFSPTRIGEFQQCIRRLVTRANGMDIFFTLIEPTRERFPVTPMPSRPVTPRTGTPASTRPGTPISPGSPPNGLREDPEQLARRRRNLQKTAFEQSHGHRSLSRYLHLRLSHHQEQHHDHSLHFSLLNLAHALSLARIQTASSAETAVGVFESQRYMAIEANRLADRHQEDYTILFVRLLHESCDELLECTQGVLDGVQAWFGEVRRASFAGKAKVQRVRAERLAKLEGLSVNVKETLNRFKKEKRHRVLDPYRSAFDPKHVRAPGFYDPPPHRYLFHCYVYQYHLMRFNSILTEVLDEIIQLEKEAQKPRLWWPSTPIRKMLDWSPWDPSEEMDRQDDEDPDIIQGIQPDWNDDLGKTGRRDPDALPPANAFQQVMHWVYDLASALTRGNVLFAIKAGLLTVILCIPTFLKATAQFAYSQRFVWGIFMGQLTLARFRGDTTFGLTARIFSTIGGCLLGTALWYISTGNGAGNPYGLAAVIAVSAPFLFYGRLYWPVPPMTNIIFFVTVALVIGFSWQDTHTTLPFKYKGWELAWRRFVLVTSGVTAAFLFSFLPPSTTLRKYQRTMMSTTVAELGAVYCLIVSFANTREHQAITRGEIVQSLVAIRLKLKRSLVLKANIVYEFSLRGRWPSKRYQKILELQLQIAYLLSHLMSVAEHLEPAWSRAFLRRTRFLDADFQGDVLAVISMISTALRTGNPLPQITPCPLLDRFMMHTHGLNVIRQEADDDYGLPRTMTIDTLENEQYLCFSVGVTTAFGIVLRLDKLMVATKELVGEQYHIHGIGVPELRSGATSPIDRPAKDA